LSTPSCRDLQTDKTLPWGLLQLAESFHRPRFHWVDFAFYAVGVKSVKAQTTEGQGSHAIYVSKLAEVAEFIREAADAAALVGRQRAGSVCLARLSPLYCVAR
jgi:hypothetical protein